MSSHRSFLTQIKGILREHKWQVLTVVISLCGGIFFNGCQKNPVANPSTSSGTLSPEQSSTALTETETLQHNWDELKKRNLRLLPVPKQISFVGKPIALTGVDARELVVVLESKTERGEIAVQEIVSRVEDLAPGTHVSILSTKKAGAYNIVIETSSPNSFTRDSSVPPDARRTDQGYGLMPDNDGIVLAGQGEMGMLYAAVTLRWLIEKAGEHVLLYPARVIDWPDFSRRGLSEFGPYNLPQYYNGFPRDPQKGLEYIKPVLDYAFRLKATDVYRSSISTYRKFSPFIEKARVEDAELALAKAINTYAMERGIKNFETVPVCLGEEWSDKDNPEVKNMLHYAVHKEYYSWARHDLHKKKAEQIAKFCSASGINSIYMHALDGGGLANPELWTDRDELTKQKYSDDRVSADADMFNIYYQAFKEKGVEIWLVCYPYGGHYLDVSFGLNSLGMADTPEQRKTVQGYIDNLKNWSTDVNKKIPLDLAICVREGDQKTMREFYNLYPGRPMFIYYEVANHRRNIRELLPNEIASFCSSYDASRSQPDILWCNYGAVGDNPLMPVTFGAQMEYAWNTSFPGAHDLKRDDDPLTSFDPQAQRILAERAAVAFFGHDAGQYIKEVYANGLSFAAVCAPRQIMGNMKTNFKRYEELGEMMSTAADKACVALDALWLKSKSEKKEGRQIMDKFSYPYFVHLRRLVKAARPYAAVHSHLEKARALILDGNLDKANLEIQAARNDLNLYSKEYSAALTEMQNEPLVFDHNLFVSWVKKLSVFPGAKVMDPDFTELEKKIAELDNNKLTLFQEYNVPLWFKEEMEKISLNALKTSAITVDGDLSEPVWREAQPIERFVAWKALKHIETPAVAYFTYDDDKLYLGFRASQEEIEKISEPKRSLKDYAFTEGIEVYILPDSGEPTSFYQIVADTAANIFTVKNGIKTESGFDGQFSCAVKKAKDSWSLELSMPFASFGKKPDDKWKAVVVYNHVSDLAKKQIDNYACVFFDAKSYSSVDRYPALNFRSIATAIPFKAPELTINQSSMEGKTHERGAGSLVTYSPRLESFRPLYDVVVNARFLDVNKKQVYTEKIFSAPFLPLSWTLPLPMKTQLENMHDALLLELNAQYRTLDGQSGNLTANTVLGDSSKFIKEDDIYAPGCRSFGITSPFCFDGQVGAERLLTYEKGTIEFWLKMNEEITPPAETYGTNKLRSFIYCGTFRPENPTNSNLHCLFIYQEKKWKNIYFNICNEKFEKRGTYVLNVPEWEKDKWMHFAFVWELDRDAKTIMAIYVNGKKASAPVMDWKSDNDSAFKIKAAVYGVQVNSFPSGEMPANAVFQDLLISRDVLYNGDFTPKPPSTAPNNGIWFSCNKTLEGKYKINGKSGVIQAKPGALIKK